MNIKLKLVKKAYIKSIGAPIGSIMVMIVSYFTGILDWNLFFWDIGVLIVMWSVCAWLGYKMFHHIW